jgi:hypothetical protein
MGRKEREPGEYGIAFYEHKFSDHNHEEKFHGLRKEICEKLLTVLERLVGSGRNPDLQLNCSHALVRWHDPEDDESGYRIKNILETQNVVSHVKHNLELALERKYTHLGNSQ